jgi:hypothetical protein
MYGSCAEPLRRCLHSAPFFAHDGAFSAQLPLLPLRCRRMRQILGPVAPVSPRAHVQAAATVKLLPILYRSNRVALILPPLERQPPDIDIEPFGASEIHQGIGQQRMGFCQYCRSLNATRLGRGRWDDRPIRPWSPALPKPIYHAPQRARSNAVASTLIAVILLPVNELAMNFPP